MFYDTAQVKTMVNLLSLTKKVTGVLRVMQDYNPLITKEDVLYGLNNSNDWESFIDVVNAMLAARQTNTDIDLDEWVASTDEEFVEKISFYTEDFAERLQKQLLSYRLGSDKELTKEQAEYLFSILWESFEDSEYVSVNVFKTTHPWEWFDQWIERFKKFDSLSDRSASVG